MKVILDTNALIFLNDFRRFEETFTAPEVIGEIKDKNTLMKLSGMNIKTREPDEKFVNEIKKMAKETGDLEKLSVTDLKILALAKESGLTIISNDYNIQNVAQKFGIGYASATDKKIKQLVLWRSYCENCDKFYDDHMYCPRCGSELVRKRVNNINLSEGKLK